MTNLEKYNAIFIEIFSISPDELHEDFSNENADNWDSIRHLGLIAGIEETFEIFLDTEDILGFTSYKLGKVILMSKYNINFN